MQKEPIKNKAIKLRSQGKTYKEIIKEIGKKISKSTLSNWCKNVNTPTFYKNKIRQLNLESLNLARQKANSVKQVQFKQYIEEISENIKPITNNLTKKEYKLMLGMLYLCEGKRAQKSSMTFGNSDPLIINLYLKLLRKSYGIDESRFRCTVQCRADQNVKELENFWSSATNIPLSKFYKAQIDRRTLNKPTLKENYKGVLRIDYFSAEIFWELQKIAQLLNMGL